MTPAPAVRLLLRVRCHKCIYETEAECLHAKHLEGKDAFDREIENEGFVGSPTLDVDRVIEEGATVVATGTGSGTQTTGDRFEFAFCTVFTFAAEHIERVESYIVPLTTTG
jgi:SnoaL-like domain